MPVQTQEARPCKIQAGDTLIFTEAEQADYPGEDWTLHYALSLYGLNKLTAAATFDGTLYTFTVAASDTAQLQPGEYQWTEYVTSGDERTTVAYGTVRVLPDSSVNRAKTQAELMLEACDAALIKLMASTNQSVSFNGQSYTKRDSGGLLTVRNTLRAAVDAERARLSGGGNWKTISTRFVNGY